MDKELLYYTPYMLVTTEIIGGTCRSSHAIIFKKVAQASQQRSIAVGLVWNHSPEIGQKDCD